MPKPKNISPTLDPASFEVIGTLDGDALDVLTQLLIDLDAAEEEEATANRKVDQQARHSRRGRNEKTPLPKGGWKRGAGLLAIARRETGIIGKVYLILNAHFSIPPAVKLALHQAGASLSFPLSQIRPPPGLGLAPSL